MTFSVATASGWPALVAATGEDQRSEEVRALRPRRRAGGHRVLVLRGGETRPDRDRYVRDMKHGAGTWAQARAEGVDEQTIARQREVRNVYYQDYLRTEAIEIDGVADALAELSPH